MAVESAHMANGCQDLRFSIVDLYLLLELVTSFPLVSLSFDFPHLDSSVGTPRSIRRRWILDPSLMPWPEPAKIDHFAG